MAGHRRDDNFDLSELNLDHIELPEDEPPNPLWRWAKLALLAGIAAGLLYLPHTPYYHTLGGGHGLTFALTIAGLAVGALLGRVIWLALQHAAKRAPAAPSELEPDEPASPWRRGVLGVLAISGILLILFGIPEWTGAQPGATFDLIWFLVAALALTVGVLLMRFLLASSARPPEAPARAPIKLPAYMRWITLAFLIGGGGAALLGTELWGESSSVRFLLSSAGFAVGVLAAIWLARRVEESEEKLKQRSGRRGSRPPASSQKTP